jgi:hypothetical protein
MTIVYSLHNLLPQIVVRPRSGGKGHNCYRLFSATDRDRAQHGMQVNQLAGFCLLQTTNRFKN